MKKYVIFASVDIVDKAHTDSADVDLLRCVVQKLDVGCRRKATNMMSGFGVSAPTREIADVLQHIQFARETKLVLN